MRPPANFFYKMVFDDARKLASSKTFYKKNLIALAAASAMISKNKIVLASSNNFIF